MAIQPVNLPTAAGIDYGKGDVRHFSPGDANDVPSLQNPTRHLAERDNLLATKVNEVIATVNNQEQFVPLPVVRTLLTPNEEITVYNYRIPAGFECRVVNAAVSATPTSQDIELKVYYSTGFGGVTGAEIISTASEFSGGVQFYNNGEFIVALKNKSGVSLELAASLLMTLRVLGAEGSLLVASVVTGERGTPGPTGPPGPQGTPGSGGEGSPGMVWAGEYSLARTYYAKEVVSYPLYGTLTSSFIASSTIPAATLTPQASYLANDGKWQPVAIGASGPTGAQGIPGTAVGAASYFNSTVSGSLYTGVEWLASDGLYYPCSFTDPDRKYTLPFQQSAVINSVTSGLAFLMYSGRFACAGFGTIWLPQKWDGALCDFAASNVHINVVSHGTIPVYIRTTDDFGTAPTLVVRTTLDGTGFVLEALDKQPQCFSVTIFGAQQVVP